jgi:hypothetical protein
MVGESLIFAAALVETRIAPLVGRAIGKYRSRVLVQELCKKVLDTSKHRLRRSGFYLTMISQKGRGEHHEDNREN